MASDASAARMWTTALTPGQPTVAIEWMNTHSCECPEIVNRPYDGLRTTQQWQGEDAEIRGIVDQLEVYDIRLSEERSKRIG
jgi:hypothetical protein